MDNKVIFQDIGTLAKKVGMEVFVVGGFVRDQLLVIPSKKDIDIVVVGDALVLAKAFAEAMGEDRGTLVEFPDFFTARYVFTKTDEAGVKTKLMEVEFASARKESYRETSRKPAVTRATLQEDLSRRDFTVNAMARSIEVDGSLGVLVDPFDGQKDLREKVIRTPLEPDQTFFDDPLRMMRAARFAAQLGFSIDPETVSSMERNAGRLKIISAERIKEELFKLLGAPQPSIGLWILYGTKLLDQFLPEVNLLAGVEEAFGYSHKDNLSHTFAVVDNIATRSDKPILRYAGLLHDIAKPQTKKFMHGRGWTFDMHEHLGKKMSYDISRRLRLSTDENKYVAKLIRWHLQPIALMDEGITDSAVRRLIVTMGDDLPDLLNLCRSDITTGNQKKKTHRLENYEKLDTRINEVIEKDKLRAFQSPVRGEEIMELCGLKPGPTIGKIKEVIEEAILSGEIPNEYEAAKVYFEKIKDGFLKEAEEWERI
ncbi:MAG: HD domain-containing protein [Candidatus Moranbacteria bacterium]|nr:HD domain-containing protein [Candidatus Moranbacteria bacterium]